MHDHPHHDRPLRVGSLFSGYGGLDLAIEHALNAETVWFSEINEPGARAFAHHWPDAPDLGSMRLVAKRVRDCTADELAKAAKHDPET